MTKYDDIIYEIASDNFGLITSSEARNAGITNIELVQYARRGKLERIGQGLYRLTQRVPEENDSYAVAVSLVGSEAYLYGEGVLGMLHLCPTNPAYLHIATPKRVRKNLPDYIHIVNVKPGENIEIYDGIRSQNVVSAIESCFSTILPDRLKTAIEKAFDEGYIDKKDKNTLNRKLEAIYDCPK